MANIGVVGSYKDEQSRGSDAPNFSTNSLYEIELGKITQGALTYENFSSDREDYYGISVEAGYEYTISMTSDAKNYGWNTFNDSSILKFEVQNYYGLNIGYSSPNQSDIYSDYFSFTPEESGTFRVKVSSSSTYPDGYDYALTMSRTLDQIGVIEAENTPAVFSDPTYSGDLVTGSTITASIDYFDVDGNSDNEMLTGWYLDDGDLTNGVDTYLDDYTSFDGSIVLADAWAGKTLYFSKGFFDDLGELESSWDGESADGLYRIGVIEAENTPESVFSIESNFGDTILEGTPDGGSEGIGDQITFTVYQTNPSLEYVWLQLSPVSSETDLFWETFASNVIGGEATSTVSTFVDVSSGSGEVTFNLAADTYVENDANFVARVYDSAVDIGTNRYLASAQYTISDDDETYVQSDTTAPDAPVITSVAEDGTLTQDELSDWSISGTAEAYSTVSIALVGDPMGAVTTTATEGGTWVFTGADLEITSISDLPPDGDGDYSFTVTATDAAGNTSEAATGTITVDVEREIQGVGVRVAGEIANMGSHVQALTESAAIATAAQTLVTAVRDSTEDDAESGNQLNVVTLLAEAAELQEFDLTTAINEVSSGGEVGLRATEQNTAVALNLGNSIANLQKTIVINDYDTVIVTGDAKVRGGEGSNNFLGDSASQDVMMGEDDDNLNAGGGNDTVGSAGGDDTISGGSGNDVAFGGSGDDSVSGGSGNDHVLDSWGSDILSGGTGDDTIRSFDGGDTIEAGDGADMVYGGCNDDSIDGGSGNDVLYGDTVIFASRGDDTIAGGAGDDIMQGGRGADTFIFNALTDGNNTIGRIGGGADFESGIDDVRLVGFSADTTSDIMAHVSDVNGKAVFDAEGITITFDGLVTSDLNADDFVFV